MARQLGRNDGKPASPPQSGDGAEQGVNSSVLPRWQRDGERRPASFPLAVGADGAAMQLHQVANDRETESEAAVLASRAGIGLTEAVEDEREKRRRDADAGIGD